MSVFIIILIVGVVAYYFMNSSKRSSEIIEYKSSKKNHDTNHGPLLYKNKGVKTVYLKGMYYQGLDITIDQGPFIGSATCEENVHDSLAVTFYNEDGKRIGYAPRGNKRLHDSIIKWHGGEVFVWGDLGYDNYSENWFAVANVPVGYSKEELETIKKKYTLLLSIKKKLKRREHSILESFEIFDLFVELEGLSAQIKIPDNLETWYPKSLIPKVSKKLEEDKDWTKLAALKKYQNQIDLLAETYKNATIKRIQKAEIELEKQNNYET